MARVKKENPAGENQAAENQEPTPESFDEAGPGMAGPPLQVEIERDRLWELYVARVAKAETVNTMRRDGKAIFRDAFIEAKCAHEVWADMTSGGNRK